MDNKVTKQRINDHLEYDWYKYVLILIVSVALFYFVFDRIHAYRDYEKIDIFVTTYPHNLSNDYENKVLADLRALSGDARERYGDAVVVSVRFNEQNPLARSYNELLMTQGAQSSDILIVGKSSLSDGGSAFLELTDEVLSYILPDDVTANDLQFCGPGNGKRQGVRVDVFSKVRNVFNFMPPDGEQNANNAPDTEFYLVINPKSVNIGTFGKKSSDKNAQALFCVREFIEFYR